MITYLRNQIQFFGGKIDLTIEIPNLENPYRNMVVNHLAGEFPANLQNKDCVLESVTADFMASSQIRYGPMPSPESLVAIRRVITKAIEANQPIPVLCPWGSKKPENSASVDIAELSGLKGLQCLQKRVVSHYAPGLQINLRVEDVGGYYLFADEGAAARESGDRYVTRFTTLIRILNLGFINTKLESDLMTEHEYVEAAEAIRPALFRYMTDTDQYGFGGYQDLDSWKELVKLGWSGSIPAEQRDYYRGRYSRLYPGTSLQDQTNKLATYLAGSLARYRLKATGAEESWGTDFIQLNFAPPAPGTPSSIGDRRVYYRTVPMNQSRTHLPAWRARGYLKISGNEVTSKIASWGEPLELEPSVVQFSRAGEQVNVQADQLIT